MRGLPEQVSDHNVQNELLDCVAEWRQAEHKPYDVVIGQNVTTDVRQSVYRNLRVGRFGCVGNSRAYVHYRDSLCVDEYLFNHGWPDGLVLPDIQVAVPELHYLGSTPVGKPRAGRQGNVSLPEVLVADGGSVKKRSVGVRNPSAAQPFLAKVVELVGQSMALFDVASVLYPIYVGMTCDEEFWMKLFRS